MAERTLIFANAGLEYFPALPAYCIFPCYTCYRFGGAVKGCNLPLRIYRKDSIRYAVEDYLGLIFSVFIHNMYTVQNITAVNTFVNCDYFSLK